MVGEIYRGAMMLHGFKAEIAQSGAAGLEALKRQRPDAIVLDIGLPDISGIEVIKRIRANPDTKDVPILVLSNSYVPKMVEEAWSAGADFCLRKVDSTPKLVAERLREIIRMKEGMAAEAAQAASAAATAGGGAASAQGSTGGQTVPTQVVQQLAITEDTVHGAIETMRREFPRKVSNQLLALRKVLATAAKEPTPAMAVTLLGTMPRPLASLATASAVIGLREFTQLSNAIEAFVQELINKPKHIGASPFRTLAYALDGLDLMSREPRTAVESASKLPPYILAVDDDAVCSEMVCVSMEKAGLNTIVVDSSRLALEMVRQNKFSLVFLDVGLPDMSGLELCTEIRKLPDYKNVPIVFVTAQSDNLEVRAKSHLSGGNDFVTKPFLLIELTVKALVHLYRGINRPKPAA